MRPINKMSLVSGFSAALCMASMILFEKYAVDRSTLSVILWQIIPFIVPCVIIGITGAIMKIPVAPRPSKLPKKSFGLVIYMSFAAFFLSLLVNSLIAAITGSSYYHTVSFSSEINQSTALTLLLMVVIPAVMEEIFFRGMLLRGFASGGTAIAIVISALCFALCHGDAKNVAGPFVAGLIYGYLVYVLDSVLPAIIGHLINNLFSLLIAYFTKAYEALGIWKYFMILCLAAFLIFTALSMSKLQSLIEKGKINRFLRCESKADLTDAVFSPGVWIIVVIFVIRVCYI